MIWIHSFNSSAIHTNVKHAKLIFFEMIYQPYEHKSSCLISKIKTTFLFRREWMCSPDKLDAFSSVWDEQPSVRKQHGKEDGTPSRPATSPNLTSSTSGTQCLGTPSQCWHLIMTMITHLGPNCRQQPLCVCTKEQEKAGLWWGEMGDGAEITFLQCSLTEITSSAPAKPWGWILGR